MCLKYEPFWLGNCWIQDIWWAKVDFCLFSMQASRRWCGAYLNLDQSQALCALLCPAQNEYARRRCQTHPVPQPGSTLEGSSVDRSAGQAEALVGSVVKAQAVVKAAGAVG